MPYSRKISILIAAAVTIAGLFLCNSYFEVNAQARLTYPEINTALQTKFPLKEPVKDFKNKAELISWLIVKIRERKVDKPLTRDREDDLRQAGATDELIAVIKANSPALPVQTPTPVPRPKVVDLGNLADKAVNLVKPEYTPEARKAGTTGEVKLALELDEQGRVTNVARLTVLPDGLTDRAIEAARQSTFTPARIDGKPVRATGVLTYNFKINTINSVAVMVAADDFRNKADCDRAIIEYTRVIDTDAKHSKALFGRGTCYLMKANYDQAVADLETAAKSSLSDADTFFYLAIAYDFKGNSPSATEAYRTAVNLKPALDKLDITSCLFIDRRRMSEDEARSAGNTIVNACNQALRNSPDFMTSLIYMKRGIGYRLKADYDKAISDFETARKLNPQFAAVRGQLHSAYNSRGLLSFNKKDYKPAFDDITTAINLNPQSPTPYVNRCVIYLYGWKQLDRAIDDCSTAIKLTNKSPMAYVHRGYAYEMKNNLDLAISDYKKALEIDPNNQAAQGHLARVQRPSIKN